MCVSVSVTDSLLSHFTTSDGWSACVCVCAPSLSPPVTLRLNPSAMWFDGFGAALGEEEEEEHTEEATVMLLLQQQQQHRGVSFGAGGCMGGATSGGGFGGMMDCDPITPSTSLVPPGFDQALYCAEGEGERRDDCCSSAPNLPCSGEEDSVLDGDETDPQCLHYESPFHLKRLTTPSSCDSYQYQHQQQQQQDEEEEEQVSGLLPPVDLGEEEHPEEQELVEEEEEEQEAVEVVPSSSCSSAMPEKTAATGSWHLECGSALGGISFTTRMHIKQAKKGEGWTDSVPDTLYSNPYVYHLDMEVGSLGGVLGRKGHEVRLMLLVEGKEIATTLDMSHGGRSLEGDTSFQLSPGKQGSSKSLWKGQSRFRFMTTSYRHHGASFELLVSVVRPQEGGDEVLFSLRSDRFRLFAKKQQSNRSRSRSRTRCLAPAPASACAPATRRKRSFADVEVVMVEDDEEEDEEDGHEDELVASSCYSSDGEYCPPSKRRNCRNSKPSLNTATLTRRVRDRLDATVARMSSAERAYLASIL